MSIFESKVELEKAVNEVYGFLSDFNNHQQLMPDNISDWTSTPNTASFNIQNMANLSLKVSNRKDNETIIIIPASAAPFNLEIRWVVADLGNNVTEAILTLSAELNMMMKMMASAPLEKFVKHQTEQLKKVLSA